MCADGHSNVRNIATGSREAGRKLHQIGSIFYGAASEPSGRARNEKEVESEGSKGKDRQHFVTNARVRGKASGSQKANRL